MELQSHYHKFVKKKVKLDFCVLRYSGVSVFSSLQNSSSHKILVINESRYNLTISESHVVEVFRKVVS